MLAVLAVGSAALVTAAPAGAGTARPTVAGPLSGGQGQPTIVSTTFDLAPFGYVQEEFTVSGEATAFTAPGSLGEDGRWEVKPGSSAPFTTRIVVVRPERARDFDGTVFVEWLNVSAGFDTAPSWAQSHLEMLRSGAAWVGVSAQAAGVQGGAATVGDATPGGVKGADPQRYAELHHPGDSYSYDIYSQVGRALAGDGTGVDPLGGLRPEHVIATGESQSATRLVTYVNAVHPAARVFDGFLIHSRFGGAAPLSQSPLPDVPAPVPTRIRTDVREPVLQFQTETDVGPLGSAAARQPDTKRLRTWEVAGTAHADVYTTLGFGDVGDGSAEVALLDYTNLSRGPLDCATPVNAGPQYAVLMAAVRHLDRWVAKGTPPPRGDRIEVTPGPGRTVGDQTVPNFVVVRDEHGNAVGGIRTPFVDAPRAALTGELNEGGRFCSLFGTTVPFDAATLAARYPSRDAFLDEFRAATNDAVEAGFILPEEARKLRAAAEQVPYGAG